MSNKKSKIRHLKEYIKDYTTKTAQIKKLDSESTLAKEFTSTNVFSSKSVKDVYNKVFYTKEQFWYWIKGMEKPSNRKKGDLDFENQDEYTKAHIEGKLIKSNSIYNGEYLIFDFDLYHKSKEALDFIIHEFDLILAAYEENEIKGNIHSYFKFENKISKAARKNFQKIVHESLIKNGIITKEEKSKVESALDHIRLPASKDYKNNMFDGDGNKIESFNDFFIALDNAEENDTKGIRSGLRIQSSSNKATKRCEIKYIANSDKKIREDLLYGPGSNHSEWYFKLISHTKNYFGTHDISFHQILEMVYLHNGPNINDEETEIIKSAWLANNESHKDTFQLQIFYNNVKEKVDSYKLSSKEKEQLSLMLKAYFYTNNIIYNRKIINNVIDVVEKIKSKEIEDSIKSGYKDKFINAQLKGSIPISEEWIIGTFKKSSKTIRKYIKYLEDIEIVTSRKFHTNTSMKSVTHIFGDDGRTTYCKHYDIENIDNAYKVYSNKIYNMPICNNYSTIFNVNQLNIKTKNTRRSVTKLEVSNEYKYLICKPKPGEYIYGSQTLIPSNLRGLTKVVITKTGLLVLDENVFRAMLFNIKDPIKKEEFLKNTRIRHYKINIWNKFGVLNKYKSDLRLKYFASKAINRKQRSTKKEMIIKKSIIELSKVVNKYLRNYKTSSLSNRLNSIRNIKKLDINNLFKKNLSITDSLNRKNNSFPYSLLYRKNYNNMIQIISYQNVSLMRAGP